MRNIKSFLATLSSRPGVYQMLGEKGVVLYVGKAKNLKKRVSSYFSKTSKDPKTALLVKHIKDISVTITHTENEAVLLECNLIKELKPRYNVLLRDDKSYPYIYLSNHRYPRLDIFRGTRKKNGQYFGPYPNSLAVREAINLIQKVFQIRTCHDSYFSARDRPCLLYQIGRCTAPCVNKVTPVDYHQQVSLAILFLKGQSDEVIDYLRIRMEEASKQQQYELAGQYRDQITRLRQLQDKQYVSLKRGNYDIVGLVHQHHTYCLQLMTIRHGQVTGSRAFYPAVPVFAGTNDVLESFISQYYLDQPANSDLLPSEIVISEPLKDKGLLESVIAAKTGYPVVISLPSRGEKATLLKMAKVSATQSLSSRLAQQMHLRDRFAALKLALRLKKTPSRLECFDISHCMGEATVASCVVFDSNGPLKSAYRRFNIKNVIPGDDVAAMNQVITRRFRHAINQDTPMPDIIFIDGGKTQLAAAALALSAVYPDYPGLLVGVSKGPERKPGMETLHRIGVPPIHLPADDDALHLIQHIRDEAHRFAITGHRLQRDKARKQSTLESIPGIGVKRRRDLLRYFGGLQGVSHASLHELMKVKGINQSLAERIFELFHDAS